MLTSPFLEQTADVAITVTCDEESATFQAHRLVVAAASPVLAKLLYPSSSELAGLVEEKVSEIPITGVHPSIFRTAWISCYTTGFPVDVKDVKELMRVANMYDMAALKHACLETLKGDMRVDNALELFDLAHSITGEEYFGSAFIRENAEEVFDTNYFLRLAPERLNLLLKDSQLSLDEQVLFSRVMEWSRAECKRQSLTPSPENMRKMLGDVVFSLRLPTLTLGDVAVFVQPSSVLTTDELCELYRYISSKKKKSVSCRFLTDARSGRIDCKDSELLTREYKDALFTMFSSPRKVTLDLMYRGSRDGFNAASFHGRCDRRGATLVVAKARNTKHVFGAYTDQSWHSNSQYVNCRGWLVSFANNFNKIVKLVASAGNTVVTNAMYCHPGYGPTFGGGHDLHISNGMDSTSNYCNPSTFRTVLGPDNKPTVGINVDNTLLAGSYNWTVEELEVFLVTIKA